MPIKQTSPSPPPPFRHPLLTPSTPQNENNKDKAPSLITKEKQ